MPLIDDIINGDIQEIDRPHICNPLIKAGLIFAPLLAGSAALVVHLRGGASHEGLLWLFAVMCIFFQTFDFRPGKRRRMLIAGVFAASIAALVSLGELDLFSLENFLKQSWFGGVYHFIERFISSAEIAVVLLFIVAANATKLISARDALWFARLIPTARAARLYITVVVAYFFICNTMGKFVVEAFYVARGRFSIGKRTKRWLPALFSASRQFTMRLLADFSEVATLIGSVLKERGYLNRNYRDDYGKNLSPEDIALLVVVLCALVIVVALPAIARE